MGSGTAQHVWGRDGQGHLSSCSIIMKEAHQSCTTRGESHTLQAFSFFLWVSFMETVSKQTVTSTTVQFSAAAVYHQIWMKRLLWSLCWSNSHSISQSALFKAGTQPGFFLKGHIMKQGFVSCFWNSQHKANPPSPFKIKGKKKKKPLRRRGWI